MKEPKPGIITAPQCEAAYEGSRVLEAGGNAADALVTAAFVQGVVDPHRCGIGGFGCATLVFRGQDPLAIDFHGRAGSRASEDMWLDIFESAAPDGFGYVLDGKVNDVGPQSITVPGMVAGLAAIHRLHGKLPWGELIERAIPYAEDGFVVSLELAEFWIRPGLHGRVSTRERLGFTEAGRAICFDPNGETYRAGQIFRQPELASTYRRIARGGYDEFYRGELGREMARGWQADGALITGEDLAGYEPTMHTPVASDVLGTRVVSSPLPGGGVALLQALKLLENSPLEAWGHNSPEYVHEVGKVLQTVWHDRLTHQGDPAFGSPDAASFLGDDYLSELGDRPEALDSSPPECTDTTQLSIIDGEGNAISFSHSLGYNSGVFAPGLGVLFNNCMSAFDPRPGQRNSIAPGKARSTAVAETIVMRDDRPWLCLGSPGAARITAGILEVLLNCIVFGMNAAEAVVQPRFDAYGPGTMLLDARFPRPQVEELERRGWNIIQSLKPFGVVGRIYTIESSANGLIAGVDPGAPGASYRARRASGN